MPDGHAMRDLIFVSMEDWDETWRRNQFVCAELSRRNPELRILFVGLPRNVSNELRHGRLRRLFRRATYSASGAANVTATHPWKLLPNSLPLGRIINQWIFRRHVCGETRRLGFDRPVLWLNPHGAGHMAGRIGESAVIYDITDDWTRIKQRASVTRLVERQDAALCAMADAVIVCSERLADLKRPLSRHVHLIPNGVNAAHYAGVRDGAGSAPSTTATASWKRPVLGYTGTVHPDRVDIELVRAIALGWPGSLALIGPDHLRAGDVARLDLPNVHRLGPVPYAEVPDYMRAFDASIVPHRMTEFTESLNPIKLWEYLAGGKPIVSTDVAGFRDFPCLVRLARTAGEFLAAAQAAVAESATPEGDALAAQRRAVARDHSWGVRVDAIEQVIADAVERRSKGTWQRSARPATEDVAHAR